jgi:FkbM family methyltransferase
MSLPTFLTQNRQILERTCRAKAQAIPMPDDVILCRILGDYLMYVDAHDRTFSPHAMTSGYWETWSTLAIARTMRTGMRCIDAGSHAGYYALLMALGTGPTGHVVAIEPQAHLAALVRWTCEINGVNTWTEVLHAAVTDIPHETITMVCDPHRKCNASLTRTPQYGEQVFTVPTVTIDMITADWPDGPLLIKADVEGAEQLLLAGMTDTLKRFSNLTMVLEVNTARYPATAETFYEILASSFPLREIDFDGNLQHVSIEQLLTKKLGQDYMLFLHQD